MVSKINMVDDESASYKSSRTHSDHSDDQKKNSVINSQISKTGTGLIKDIEGNINKKDGINMNSVLLANRFKTRMMNRIMDEKLLNQTAVYSRFINIGDI